MGRWRERIRYRLGLSPLKTFVRPSPTSRHLFPALPVFSSMYITPLMALLSFGATFSLGRWRERIRYRLGLSPLKTFVRPSPTSRHLFMALKVTNPSCVCYPFPVFPDVKAARLNPTGLNLLILATLRYRFRALQLAIT